MKRISRNLMVVLSLMAAVCHAVSCDILGAGGSSAHEGEGQLRIAFASSHSEATKSLQNLPDTSDFILTVSNADGDIVYDGPYGDSPESIKVKSGSYTVSVVSEKFTKPAFSAPQFGDEQCVVVPAEAVINVKLSCSQINCGVKLDIDPGFLTACPDGTLSLKSAQGSLMYGYSEKRAAYFSPGVISLVLSRKGNDEVLMKRQLEACQMLVLGVSVADQTADASGRDNVSISIDTSRVWLSDSCVIGDDAGNGNGTDDAITVSQVVSHVGEEDIWVSGYIVGGNLTSASALFEPPFSSRTCILLGPRSSTKDRASCISVQLPAGEVREALNLVDNPQLLGRKVLIQGDVVSSYYGLVGLKNCSDYKL